MRCNPTMNPLTVSIFAYTTTYTIFSTLRVIIPWMESFTFQVTPWKKTCIQQKNRSNCCCARGFQGQGVRFEYTGDAERMTCSDVVSPDSVLKNRATDYEQLRDQKENYCTTCDSDYGSLVDSYGVSAEDIVEERYCSEDSACDAKYSALDTTWNGTNMMETFCTSCNVDI